MSTAPALGRMSYAEYLAFERGSEQKHEYVNGVRFAMAGGTPEHARLAMTLGLLIGPGLRGRACAMYSSDLRVRVEATGRSTYPDLTIVCDRLERATDDEDAAVNPTVIVEILSETTEASDRGDEWGHYQRIGSLKEYVLVSQHARRVEVFRRTEDGWHYGEVSGEGVVELRAVGVSFSLEALYADPLAERPQG